MWEPVNEAIPPSLKECPRCKNVDYIYSIRGQESCLHCQLDRIWDFMEGTRRMTQGEE